MILQGFWLRFTLLFMGSVKLVAVINPEELVNLIEYYFISQNIFVVTYYSCFSMDENVKLAEKFAEHSIQSRFIMTTKHLNSLIDTPFTTRQGFFVTEGCQDVVDKYFAQENHLILFRDYNVWLFINDRLRLLDNVWEIINQRFEGIDILPMSNVVYASKQNTSNEITWVFYDVYKISSNSPLLITEFGKSIVDNPTNSTILKELSRIRPSRDNFMQLKLSCGLVIAYPEKFTTMDNYLNDHIDIFTKATWPVVQILYENLNMTCEVMQTDSYGWLKNGTFDGVMGLFQKKKIDVLSHGTNMRVDRLAYIEFTAEIFEISTPFIFRQPPLSAISNIFILPLNWSVWICLLIMVFVIIVIMYIQLLNPVMKHKIFDIITFVCGAVCQQGTVLLLPTTSIRLIVLTTFLSMLALFTSYSASIVALLQSPSHSIRSIEDLIDSPIRMGIQEAGYNRYNYIYENQSKLKMVYKKRILPLGTKGWIYDTIEGIERVRTDLFALQVESTTAYKAIARSFTESEKCSLSEIHLLRLPVTTMTVLRNSPYKEIFKRRLRWLRENGLMNRVKRRWLLKKPICEGGNRDVRTVGIQEVKPALILLLMGIIISFIILIIETILKRIRISAMRKMKE